MHREKTGDTFSRQMSLVKMIGAQWKMEIRLGCQESG